MLPSPCRRDLTSSPSLGPPLLTGPLGLLSHPPLRLSSHPPPHPPLRLLSHPPCPPSFFHAGPRRGAARVRLPLHVPEGLLIPRAHAGAISPASPPASPLHLPASDRRPTHTSSARRSSAPPPRAPRPPTRTKARPCAKSTFGMSLRAAGPFRRRRTAGPSRTARPRA